LLPFDPYSHRVAHASTLNEIILKSSVFGCDADHKIQEFDADHKNSLFARQVLSIPGAFGEK
jgi:hypothetical protein